MIHARCGSQITNITNKKMPALKNKYHRIHVVKNKVDEDCGLTYEQRFARTSVLSDYIEKIGNDINMLSYQEDFECKYVSMFQTLVIIGILIFIFFDRRKK